MRPAIHSDPPCVNTARECAVRRIFPRPLIGMTGASRATACALQNVRLLRSVTLGHTKQLRRVKLGPPYTLQYLVRPWILRASAALPRDGKQPSIVIRRARLHPV